MQSIYYIIISIITFYYFTGILCTETSENVICENTTNGVIINKSDIKEKREFNFSEFATLTEHNTLLNQNFIIVEIDSQKQELNLLKNKQKVLIIKMKFILNLPRKDDNWKNNEERLQFKTLFDDFTFMTCKMHKILVNSFLKQISCYDSSISLVLNNIIIMKNMYSNLMKKLDRNVSNLSIVTQLKETIICLVDLNSKLEIGYDYHLELKEKMLANVNALKKSFELTTYELTKLSESLMVKDLSFIKERLIKIFQLYDETEKSSVYGVENSFKLFLNSSFKNLTILNNSMHGFINSK
ncbi:hypothetical protein NBO_561g0001 [Nosema bombycis CQ1]|uniref:Uncharacterized protein n=1 Tax=Nosema bombycis (strain CQ1 / CVCC 102059) TaxID=578461 RepID=R0KN35_NOSB1|nr:hypothetical protein NBO_561g0001 [Nosema bombycis CQ1]|eukprot:EOB12066.1 hypothetical protein NBO_561g0001 [Nosema bombycis CQ1]